MKSRNENAEHAAGLIRTFPIFWSINLVSSLYYPADTVSKDDEIFLCLKRYMSLSTWFRLKERWSFILFCKRREAWWSKECLKISSASPCNWWSTCKQIILTFSELFYICHDLWTKINWLRRLFMWVRNNSALAPEPI